jgi:hypothetical protein
VALGAIVLLIGVIWGVVLPQVTRFRAVAEWIDRNESRGIDPSARYYSDHDAYPGFVHRINQLRESHDEAFWQPSSR